MVAFVDDNQHLDAIHESWLAKRSLSDAVSNSAVDELYQRALDAGAVGGKLTGAGGGGFLLLFVPPKKRRAVLEALSELLHVPFEFENAGSRIICNEPGVDYEEVEQGRRLRTTPAFRELPTAV